MKKKCHITFTEQYFNSGSFTDLMFPEWIEVVGNVAVLLKRLNLYPNFCLYILSSFLLFLFHSINFKFTVKFLQYNN